MSKDDKEKHKDKIKNFGDKLQKNGFDKNPEGAGRKTNPFVDFTKKYDYIKVTPKDVGHAIEALAGASPSVLRDIIANKEAPQVLRIMAKELVDAEYAEDFKQKNMVVRMIYDLFERIAGKAPQHITVAQENNATIDLSALTEEELIAWSQIHTKLSQ